MDDLPKEAWIILYVTNEPSDWIGCFPSDHYQQYYTQRRNGLPHHFDSYQEAREFAEREYLDYYIIVPIAGEPAIKFATEQKRLCNIPDVVGRSEQLVCDIEKGTRCKDSFPSYKDGKCHNCGGQAN